MQSNLDGGVSFTGESGYWPLLFIDALNNSNLLNIPHRINLLQRINASDFNLWFERNFDMELNRKQIKRVNQCEVNAGFFL
jgi:hypothetical protein